MRIRTTTIAVLLATTAALTACSSSNSKADPAACKAAMTQQYKDAAAKGDNAPQGKRPAACDGVDDKTVQRYATEIIAKELPKAVESALPDATGTPDITPKCRKWIESELTDGTDSVNATAGLKACPGMDSDQLNAAIDTVTNEMLNSATATP
ncbi:hypothetical protein [Streptomyces sp. NPDC048385]|uniref:hypothetical protein n=1 Tax=unclassified Streptomyces TaxID=2593676 RepID=UPI00342A381E